MQKVGSQAFHQSMVISYIRAIRGPLAFFSDSGFRQHFREDPGGENHAPRRRVQRGSGVTSRRRPQLLPVIPKDRKKQLHPAPGDQRLAAGRGVQPRFPEAAAPEFNPNIQLWVGFLLKQKLDPHADQLHYFRRFDRKVFPHLRR